MERIKLQNVVLPQDKAELFFHAKDDELYFDGYFNLFDVSARKKYTELKKVILQIKCVGMTALFLMHDKDEIGEYKLSDQVVVEIQVPYEKYSDGGFWFRLKPDGNLAEKTLGAKRDCGVAKAEKCGEKTDFQMQGMEMVYQAPEIEAAYYGIVDSLRKTDICIGMCTYKREDYVQQNMNAVAQVMKSNEEVAEHLSMYVVDNGNTLNEAALEFESNIASRFRIIPNKNAGGASGFSRAMIETIKARKEKGFTHILLMDDDVTIMEDLFVRLYGLLSMLKEEYKDIRIGGELFRKEFPAVLNARGEWSENFRIRSDNRLIDLRSMEKCRAVLGRKKNDERIYTGWWCACYSLDMIEKTSLPLPLFIHEDDICFEKEHAKYKLMYLNGISVWHNGFEFGNFGTNQYYHIRNKLIASSLYEPEIRSTGAAKWVAKCMIALLISYRYEEIELIERGVQDYLKGAEWLYNVDAEKINSDIRDFFALYGMKEDDFIKYQDERFAKLRIIDPEFVQAHGRENKAKVEVMAKKSYEKKRELQTLPESLVRRIVDYRKNYGVQELIKYSSEDRTSGHMLNKLTLNGWILPANRKYVEMTLIDSPFKSYRAKNIVLFDPGSEKSVILKKDYRKFMASIVRIAKIVSAVKKHYDKTAENYREKKAGISSIESWERYLGI